MPIVISGFPGIGKTECAKKHFDILDLDSSSYHKGTRRSDPVWVDRYVLDIEQVLDSAVDNKDIRYILASSPREVGEKMQEHVFPLRYILVSSHREVREKMKERGIPYLFVAPDPACKNEYLIRYLRRGSSVSFIKKLSDMWCEYIWPLEDETIIRLGKGVYLDDILSEGIWC